MVDVEKILDLIEDDDDVQAVYTNLAEPYLDAFTLGLILPACSTASISMGADR